SLVELAARMEPTKAAAVRSRAAAVLVQAMSKQTEGYRVNTLGHALVAVRGETDPEATAQLVLEGMRALPGLQEPGRASSGLPDPARAYSGLPDQHTMASALSPLVFGVSPTEAARGRDAIVLAIGACGFQGTFSGLPLLHPQFQPRLRPLPPQALVELLKHP